MRPYSLSPLIRPSINCCSRCMLSGLSDSYSRLQMARVNWPTKLDRSQAHWVSVNKRTRVYLFKALWKLNPAPIWHPFSAMFVFWHSTSFCIGKLKETQSAVPSGLKPVPSSPRDDNCKKPTESCDKAKQCCSAIQNSSVCQEWQCEIVPVSLCAISKCLVLMASVQLSHLLEPYLIWTRKSASFITH